MMIKSKKFGLSSNQNHTASQYSNHAGLQMADPSFYKPSFVEALLCDDIDPKLFLQGVPNQTTSDGYPKTHGMDCISTIDFTKKSCLHVHNDE